MKSALADGYPLRYHSDSASLVTVARKRALTVREIGLVAADEYARFAYLLEMAAGRVERPRTESRARLPGRSQLYLSAALEELVFAGGVARTEKWQWGFYERFGVYAHKAWLIAHRGVPGRRFLEWGRQDNFSLTGSVFDAYFSLLANEPPVTEARIGYWAKLVRQDTSKYIFGYPRIVELGESAREYLVQALKDGLSRGDDIQWLAALAVPALGAVGDERIREIDPGWLPAGRPRLRALYSRYVDVPAGTVDVRMTRVGSFLGWSGSLQCYGPFPGYMLGQERPSEVARGIRHALTSGKLSDADRPVDCGRFAPYSGIELE